MAPPKGFRPPNAGKGRPKGSRNKLQEDFLRDFCRAWDEHGLAAVLDMARNDPSKFVEAAIKVLPKEVNVTTKRAAAELSDDELAAIIAGSRDGASDEEGHTGLTH